MTSPVPEILVVAAALALVVVAHAARRLRHRRALASIPIRIHVGGTRGKSATTRLIAAGLRSGGIRTVAKTTGTEPRWIGADGAERPWRRFGPASIAEQFGFVRRARREGARAFVLECMAIRPELVRASEHLIVRATIAVVTNVRPDHLEDADPEAAALELVPAGGVVVATSEAAIPGLERVARARGARVEIVDIAALDPERANRALAERVCRLAGVAAPDLRLGVADPGAFFVKSLAVAGKRLRFANAFACNDTVSLDHLLASVDDDAAPVMLLNHRNDRPLRSLQFLAHLARMPDRPMLLAMGSTAWLRRAARRHGLALTPIGAREPRSILRALGESAPDGATVWGIANYHGPAAALVRAVKDA